MDPDEAPLTNEERLGLLGDARRVCEEKLGSRTVAFQWCARAYQVAPEDVAVVGDLERLARDADEWPAYAELLNKRLDEPDVSRQPGRDERIDLLRRLLRVNVTRLQKVDAARRSAERILELLPDDEEAERALERILEERKEWPGLVTIWRRREARLSDRTKKMELRFRIARAEEEELDDLPAAAKTLRGILQSEPRNARALASLARVSEVTGDMASVAEIIRRQIDEGLAGDPLAALLRLGRAGRDLARPPRQGPGRLPRGPGGRSGLARRRGRAGAVAGGRRGQDCGSVGAEEGDKGDKAEQRKGKKGKPAPSDPAVLDVVARLIPYYELTENYKKWAGALETLSGRGRARGTPGAPAQPGRPLRRAAGGQRLGVPDGDQDLRAGAARHAASASAWWAWRPRWTAPRTCWTRSAGC